MRDLTILMVVGLMLIALSPLSANNEVTTDPKIQQDTVSQVPKVFVLGSHETEYDQLSIEYGNSLLAANNDDFTVAMSKWNSMLKEMEAHAEMLEYDIKGIKMWLHVFWDDNGQINHIGYYLKPNSRNVDKDELTSFLMDFVNNYHLPISSERKFSHYSGAAFPSLNWKIKNTNINVKKN